MSSTSPNPQSHNEKSAVEAILREALRQDLEQFLDADVHISGYIVAWISRRLPLELLEGLVDELEGVFTVGGRSILTGQPRKK
jgi:hypothetical protein